jgi:hypothetical protein
MTFSTYFCHFLSVSTNIFRKKFIPKRPQCFSHSTRLSCTSVYDGCIKFSEGREKVTNRPQAHVQATAATDVNIRRVEDLILETRRISVRDVASRTCIAVRLPIRKKRRKKRSQKIIVLHDNAVRVQ